MRKALITVAIAGLAGCAMTPNQVLETEALVSARLASNISVIAPCLQQGMEDIAAAWNVSSVPDKSGTGINLRLHGHMDTGTIAVVRLRAGTQVTEFSVHITNAVFPREPLATKIRDLALACDRH